MTPGHHPLLEASQTSLIPIFISPPMKVRKKQGIPQKAQHLCFFQEGVVQFLKILKETARGKTPWSCHTRMLSPFRSLF